jgi:hypothetical protein
MKNKEELRNEISELVKGLRFNDPDSKSTLDKIRALEAEIKNLDRIALLSGVNGKQERLRALALKAWECEQPSEDITTMDGGFHKVKIKKYPNLAALPYTTASFKDNRLVSLSINGEKFQMHHQKSEYQKETEYTRPETFEDFLNLNAIMVQPLPIEEFNEFCDKLDAENKKIEERIKEYKATLNALNVPRLNYFGLVNQRNSHFYQYENK